MMLPKPSVLLHFLLGTITSLVISLPVGATDNYLHHSIQATILVADSDQTGDLIQEWTEENGGYLLLKSSERATVRFPYTRISDFRRFLESTADMVIEISPQAVDLRESMLGLESGIRSREEILAKNLSFIDQADIAGTLAIEREIMQLIQEIETMKGQLRKLNVDREMVRAEIYLRFMEQTLPSDIPSSFAWINTVDFYSFMREGF
jgi:hypothetical protein